MLIAIDLFKFPHVNNAVLEGLKPQIDIPHNKFVYVHCKAFGKDICYSVFYMLLITIKGVSPCAFEMLQEQKETFYKRSTKYVLVYLIGVFKESTLGFYFWFYFSYHICVNLNFLCLHFMPRHFQKVALIV